MKRFGLIGYPLKNSFSANYFSSKFLQLGLLDHIYENYPLEQIEAFTHLRNQYPDLSGLNVTIPHKETIIPYLDLLHETASEVGAVNCIHFQNGIAVGYNTDVIGFEESLKSWLPINQTDRALILGTGGAAKAVKVALTHLGIASLMVSRTSGKGDLIYADLTESLLSQHRLIINATPAGMHPNVHEAPPFPYAFITNDHFAYDLIYLPVETHFLSCCKQQGATTKNGLEMLHLQAEAAWKIWK